MLWLKQKKTSFTTSLCRLGTVCLCLFVFGCESDKSIQCQQIFSLAQNVNQSNQNLQDGDKGELNSMKSWLEAANKFDRAADKIEALKIERGELMQYQHRLARIYRIYAQTTYDAVSARENKNLSALESARKDAVKAGTLQRQLVREINDYCLKSEPM